MAVIFRFLSLIWRWLGGVGGSNIGTIANVMSWIRRSAIAKAFLGVALAVYTYPDLREIIKNAEQQMQFLFGTLPADIFSILCVMQVPQGMGIILTAVSSVATFKALKLAIMRR